MSPSHLPIASVACGEVFTIKTRSPGIPDELFNREYSDRQYPQRILSITGPVLIKGVPAGGVVRITIEAIELETVGKCWMGPWMGALMHETTAPLLKKLEITAEGVEVLPGRVLPLRPMIGTIGVAPPAEIDCLYPGRHGGNMDTTSIAPGNRVYLRANVDGALLAVGDVHAAMGDGEVFGTGVEIGSVVTLRVDLVDFAWPGHPVVETGDSYEIIVSDVDLMAACRTATRTASTFLAARVGVSFSDAYAAIGMHADLRVSQIVNHVCTVRIVLPKRLTDTSV